MNRFKLILTLFLSTIFIGNVDASSFTIGVGNKTLNPSGTTTLTISASDITGRFNISTSNSSVVSISDSSVWVENNKVSIKLSALKIGSATITVSPVSGISDSSGNPISLSSKSIAITVQKPREKSSDNNLKSLTVEGYTLNEEFNKDTLEYSVDVPEGTTMINVIAPSNDGYASVSGAGELTVNPGVNNFDIIVTPETGAIKTYKLIVNVIDQNPVSITIGKNKYTLIKYENAFTCPDNFDSISIEIDEYKVPACQNDTIKYTLVGIKDKEGNIFLASYKSNKYTLFNELKSSNNSILPLKFKGKINNYIKTTIKINNIDVECYKYKKTSKTCIIYALDLNNGDKNYYIYDLNNKNFILYDNEYISYLETNNKYLLIASVSFAVGLFISFISLISINKKKKKNKKKDAINKKEEKKNIENTEVYNIFEDEKKSKKKNKVK